MPATECWHLSEVQDFGPQPVIEYLDEALDADNVGLK